MTPIVLLLVPITALACIPVAYTSRRIRRGYPEPVPLSFSAKAALEQLSEPKPDFRMVRPSLQRRDLLSLYGNSRLAAREAHRLLLQHAGDEDFEASVIIAEDRHRRLKALILMTLFEQAVSLVFRSRLPLYARALLWTYSEMIELIHQLAQDSGDPLTAALAARL